MSAAIVRTQEEIDALANRAAELFDAETSPLSRAT